MSKAEQPVGALTVDVEDYYQVSAFEDEIPRESWGDFESRVVRNTHRILELFSRHNVKGTFFILGWVAKHHPALVEEISDAGHEVGSHSYWHHLVYRQQPDEFRCDLRRSRDVLQEITNRPVTVYRAPSFSITRRSMWALEILVEEGFQVDSSIFPIHHDRYGVPGAKPYIHVLDTPAGPIHEFPPTVARVARLNLPVSGGGYFRLYPLAATRYALSRASNKNGHPFMFYIHPWEVDPGQPRLQAGSRLSRFRHRVNLSTTEEKLGKLLRSFRFSTIADLIEADRGKADEPVALAR